MSDALTHLQEVAELEGWECSEYNPDTGYMRISNGARFADVWFAPDKRVRQILLQLQTLSTTKYQRTTSRDKRAQVVSWLLHGVLINQS